MTESMSHNISQKISPTDIVKVSDNNIYIYFRYFEKKTDYTDLLTHIIKIMNTFKEVQNISGKENFVKVLADFEGIKIAKLDFDFIKELLNYLETNYDNLLSEVYCLNVTVVFKMAYKILKPMLNKKVRSKIKFLKKGENSKLIEIPEKELDDI